MDCKLCGAVNRWIKQPFDPDGSVINWFLMVGLVLIAIWFWSRIIVRIAP